MISGIHLKQQSHMMKFITQPCLECHFHHFTHREEIYGSFVETTRLIQVLYEWITSDDS
jgi:hypothetical protein